MLSDNVEMKTLLKTLTCRNTGNSLSYIGLPTKYYGLWLTIEPLRYCQPEYYDSFVENRQFYLAYEA